MQDKKLTETLNKLNAMSIEERVKYNETAELRIAEIKHHFTAISEMKGMYKTNTNDWCFKNFDVEKPGLVIELKNLERIVSKNQREGRF